MLLLGAFCARGQQIGPNARRQIAALLSEKATRTAAQRKMNSHLVHAAKILRGQAVHPDFPAPPDAMPAVRLDSRNQVQVDLEASVTPDLVNYIGTLGGTVVTSFPQHRSLRVQIPLLAAERLAARADVAEVRPAEEPWILGPHARLHRSGGGEAYGARSAVSRLARLFGGPARPMEHGKGFLRPPNAAFFAGPDLSGDVAHQSDIERAKYGFDGTGVKIGVLSSGVSGLAAEQAAGRLPDVTVLPGQTGSGSEGTAMLEIIYTIAPGATLYFATAGGGSANMAANIQALAAAGCRIIVDDVAYSSETVFQDALLARTVNAVAASGVYYFSAAGNAGSLKKHITEVWEGDFVDSGVTLDPLIPGASLHSFSGPAADPLIIPSQAGFYSLSWSDPLGQSANDYDLFILDSTLSNVVASSTNFQTGTQNPQEAILDLTHQVVAGDYVVIVRNSGAAVRALHFDAWSAWLAIGTTGATFGHNAAAGAITVAATDVFNAAGGAFTGGARNPVEYFSSDGPRRMFLRPDGTPFTPGNVKFSTNGGIVLKKPDITAADGVSTGVQGFAPFYGTSAAAPHAAAIAALVLQAVPSITVEQMRAVLAASALDIEDPGPDINSGAGIVMAAAAIEATMAKCTYSFTPGGAAFSSSGGSGTVSVGAPPLCPWTLSSQTPWIFLGPDASGTGNSTASYQVASNLGDARWGSLAAGDQSFTVEQGPLFATGGLAAGSLPQLASQGGWKTVFTYLNLGTAPAQGRMNFFDNNGAPLTLPFTFPQLSASNAPLFASGFDRVIGPGAQFVAATVGPDPKQLSGWSQLAGNGALNGFGIFSNPALKWEAVVPLETRNAPKYLLAFDNTGGLATGLAIANLTSAATSVPVTLRDDTGAQIGGAVIPLAGYGHSSFLLTDKYPATQNLRGTIEFGTPPGGRISVLGLRVNGPALTTLPVLANVDASGGSITHILFNGGFTNSFTLVNTGSTEASATLRFFGNDGSTLSVPLSLPQTGETVNTPALTRTLGPGASLVIQTAGEQSLPSVEGSAQLTATGNVSGFGIFRWTQYQQEASVPLESRNMPGYVLAFDNTNGTATGLALANVAGPAATVAIHIRDESGALLASTTQDLPANGHLSFVLASKYPAAANRRGTVEFVTPAGGRISAIGLRATASGTLTTIPVLTK